MNVLTSERTALIGAISLPVANSLELRDIVKNFGGVQALKGVSFSVRGGEVHALLGENGAGKSTLMGVAAGETAPDSGSVLVDGRLVIQLNHQSARGMGIAIVHQSPTLIPALTVLENFRLSVPSSLYAGEVFADWVRRQLESVRCTVSPRARAVDLSISQRQQIELAKALALNPRILILDEPTAALTADMVSVLFDKVRTAARSGTAVIYISHRLEEIRQICDRVTILRDGRFQIVSPIADLGDDDILRYIVGRETDTVYPKKGGATLAGGVSVRNLSGASFEGVSLDVPAGEVVGLAGITGNGQADFMRALAGMEPFTGDVVLDGKPLSLTGPASAHAARICFMSSDRPNEGLVLRLSVRENAAVGALERFARHGILSGRRERDAVDRQRHALAVKAPSIESPVSTLSGGNQQKVVLARALLAEPQLLLAEEPTAGVDIGARAEIYHIVRGVAQSGKAVLILSSDLAELEGLCDRVYVFSRGRIVAELKGDDVTQENIGREMIKAPTTFRAQKDERGKRQFARIASGAAAFVASDAAPAAILAAVLVILSSYVFTVNPLFLSAFNIERMLLMVAALTLIGAGQLCVVLTGGLDLSIGPLVGLCVVVASFFFGNVESLPTIMLGILLVIGAGLATGLANGVLVEALKFTPVAATLGVYIILQGCSVLLRPYPDGPIDTALMDFVQASYLGVPAVFIVSVVVVLGLELALRHSRWGLALRAVGSERQFATKIGVRTNLTVLSAYLAASVLAAIGGLLVAMQLGIGDPNQGVEYTLSSVAAVVLGGASLFGGRGSFVTVLLGAMLLVLIKGAMPFLGLGGAWQYWFMGGLILISVAVYSKARA